MPLENLLSYFPEKISGPLRILNKNCSEKNNYAPGGSEVQEIRMRSALPLCVTVKGENYFVSRGGRLESCGTPAGIIVEKRDMDIILSNICESSVYAYQNQMKQGFITVRGGCRVGICGTAVYSNGEISYLKDISSMNFRISRNIPGAANAVMPVINNGVIRGALIASPPCGGKTTILRDLARQLSQKYRVAVADERGEIGSGGIMCDVLTGYKKAEGMLHAVRSLSPQVIMCDEIGAADEVEAVINCMNAGTPVIATAHAGSEEELYRRPPIRMLLASGAVEVIILLHGSNEPGKIKKIIEVSGLETCGLNDIGNDMYIHRAKDVAEIAPPVR